MSNLMACKLCGTRVKTTVVNSFLGETTGVHQVCPCCGEFKMSGTVSDDITQQGARLPDQNVKIKLSGWILDQNRDGIDPVITNDVLKNVISRPLPTFEERANRVLFEAARGQDKIGINYASDDLRLIAATYSRSDLELCFLLQLLSNRGLVKKINKNLYKLLPEGYVVADELLRKPAISAKGFVAMWFDKSVEQAYENGFDPGIRNAGYDPVRIDRTEHINKIDDEIIAHIRSSAFVVADFTGHRGGVYFEAGFALGRDLPVIWTCRMDQMDELHFDIRQYNCIVWEKQKLEVLAKNLQHRIEAVLGKGPKQVS